MTPTNLAANWPTRAGASPPPLTAESVAWTHEVVRPYVRRTPVLRVAGDDFGLGDFPLTFKLESVQHSGSFKARGAFANLLLRRVPPAGVAAASGGNHGVAVAYAARRLGIAARVFVPTICSSAKLERLQAYGAQVTVAGDRYADALAACENACEHLRAMQIHAFDQVETLLGQATLARELEQQVPDADTILMAVGGGGLIGGAAIWYGPRRQRLLGVEPVEAPTLTLALAAGQPVDAPAGGVAADSLAPRRVGRLAFSSAQQRVDGVSLVPDSAILRAQEVLWQELRLLVEPGGAAAFAALLSGRYRPAPGEHVAVVLCGGNTAR